LITTRHFGVVAVIGSKRVPMPAARRSARIPVPINRG
jgi:hypothetical protein